MLNTRFLNQRNIINEELIGRTRFMVVGAGAIGSFFVTYISKMGARNIEVCDYDSIENHNFANQMYPVEALGKPKVEALKDIALRFGESNIVVKNSPWTPVERGEEDVVDTFVSCVDNMDVRRSLWDFYKTRCRFYIDGRMSAQVYKVFGVDTSNKEACEYYESTLHSQAVASPEPCGEKSIIYTVAQVSAQMCSQVKKYLNGEYRPTAVIYDCFNDTIEKVYHQKEEMPIIVYEESNN